MDIELMNADKALKLLKMKLGPIAKKMLEYAHKNWVKHGNESEIEDYTAAIGDLMLTYVVEDFGSKGVYRILNIQYLVDGMRLSKLACDVIARDLFHFQRGLCRADNMGSVSYIEEYTRDKYEIIT